ncbi:ly6/PLAUR domain-containing protein 3-like [Pyxicephalus adspersus]
MKSRILYISPVTIICMISLLGLQGIQAEPIECYTCKDEGDGGCLPDKAMNVSCPLDRDMCVETIIAIVTSHDKHVVLMKGCGFGSPAVLNKNILSYGISIYMHLKQCNTSLCNTNMDLKNYQLAPADNETRVPNDDQCYSCIGKPKTECSPSNAPVMQCFNTYSHCFDGNVTVSIDNDTIVIPVKSCSMRYRCSVHSLIYGSVSTEIRGACCSEGICNSDLSDKTHLADQPFLVVLNDQNEEQAHTAPPPQWITAVPGTDSTPTNGSIARDGDSPESSVLTQDSENNAACGLSFSLWLFIFLITVS